MIPDAHWSNEQVENLNRFQGSGIFKPVECPGEHGGSKILTATNCGWVCPNCDYRRNWAEEFMLNFSADQLEEASVFLPPKVPTEEEMTLALEQDLGQLVSQMKPRKGGMRHGQFWFSKEIPFNDFNREIVHPGVMKKYPSGVLGIRTDGDFWSCAVLPYRFKDLPVERIVAILWPEIQDPEFGPDTIPGNPLDFEN